LRWTKIVKLVWTHRLTSALDPLQRQAEETFREVEPQLRFFVFGTLTHRTQRRLRTSAAIQVCPEHPSSFDAPSSRSEDF